MRHFTALVHHDCSSTSQRCSNALRTLISVQATPQTTNIRANPQTTNITTRKSTSAFATPMTHQEAQLHAVGAELAAAELLEGGLDDLNTKKHAPLFAEVNAWEDYLHNSNDFLRPPNTRHSSPPMPICLLWYFPTAFTTGLFTKALKYIAEHVRRLEGSIELYPLSSKGALLDTAPWRRPNHPQYIDQLSECAKASFRVLTLTPIESRNLERDNFPDGVPLTTPQPSSQGACGSRLSTDAAGCASRPGASTHVPRS